MISAYIEVIKDSFFSGFIFTFSKEFAYQYILQFNNYDHNIAAICAIVGSTLGFLGTYTVFYLFAGVFKKVLESSSNYFIIKDGFKKYGFLIFAWVIVPDFNILVPVFSGMVRYNIKSFIFLIILYRSIYYFYLLYG